MGFRFRKSLKILPGVRVNLSTSGTSLTLGGRGASVNVGKRGVYGNLGLPGTGISWRERLDKPSARRSQPQSGLSTAPQTPPPPDSVNVRFEGNTIQFVDSRGVPVDPFYLPMIKDRCKEDITNYLAALADERNQKVDQLRQLHWDVPREVGQQKPSAAGKPQRESFSSQESYMQALMTWRAQQANAGSTFSPAEVEDALLECLGALSWPAETNIAVSLTGSRLLLDVDLPEIEDMPRGRWTPSLARLTIDEKPMSQKDVAALYVDHVSSVIVRLIGHAMAASSAIEAVAVSAYTQRSAAIGRPANEYVATCEVRRAQWQQVDLTNLRAVDPHNLLRHFGACIATNARGVLLAQTPLL